MSVASVASATLRADGLRLFRDRFLIGVGLYILALSIAMRWAIPAIASGVASRWGFDLTPYYALIASHILVQLAPQLVGVLGAFLLLETREDGTVKALLVSPLPFSSYLVIVSVAMVLVSVALTVVEGALIGLALPSWSALAATGLAGGFAAPMFALFVAAVADNKPEAFAYLKGLGILPMIPTGAFFLSEPTQWLATVYPPYWAMKAYWLAEAGESNWPFWILGGVAVSTLWVWLLMRLYNRAARR